MDVDEHFMKLALKEAKKGWGLTSPNPMVGAVLIRNGIVLGKGYHRGAGLPHAEPNAIADANGNTSDATLYVTLEPCSTYGRTPPCTKAIIGANIKRVVIGCLDPNPKHAGQGISILQNNGIQVQAGVLENECSALNEAFFHWITTGRPFVKLKMAMTLDGKIATESGDSKWITGEKARRVVQKLRQASDAIMVGGNTAVIDNPTLNVRIPKNWPRQPKRFVWTSQTQLPSHLDLASNQHGEPATLVKPVTQPQWIQFLESLGSQQIISLMIEGGGELAGCAIQANIVNRIDFFIAPKILGGKNSRPVVGWNSPQFLAQAIPVKNWSVAKCGDDIHYSGLLNAFTPRHFLR